MAVLCLLLLVLVVLQATRADDPPAIALAAAAGCSAGFAFSRYVVGHLAGPRRQPPVPLWRVLIMVSIVAAAVTLVLTGVVGSPTTPVVSAVLLGILLDGLMPQRRQRS